MTLNNKLISPCKDCTVRVLLCHDSCNTYREFKSNREQVQAARQDFLKTRSMGYSYRDRVKGN
jgi:hypothetical protein